MARKKKVEEVVENPTPMGENAMNPPEVEEGGAGAYPSATKEPVFKFVDCSASKVNVRDSAEGNVLFTIDTGKKVLVEEEKDGWTKIYGYIMSSLLK